jgi:hypothetical protein
MGLVARSVGADAARIGGAWYIGELSPEDRGVLVRRVPGYPLPELRAAVLSITSTDGRASVLEGGVIVVGDRVELLERVTELLDGVEQARGGTWSVGAVCCERVGGRFKLRRTGGAARTVMVSPRRGGIWGDVG